MSRTWKPAAILALVLTVIGGRAWAQKELPVSLTGRILFGFDQYSSDHHSRGGPISTLEADLKGYWRDPRILEFEFRPTTTIGEAVPGTETGNAITGFAAMGKILEGSQFPLTLSFSRSTSSFEESIGSFNGVLSGVEIGTTNNVFDVNWLLRFRHLPTVSLNYRDNEYSSDLPTQFGGKDEHSVRNFVGQINYNVWKWQLVGRYQRTRSTATFPDILSGDSQQDRDTTENVGFSAARLLPLHSSLSLSADQTKSDFTFDGLSSNTTARVADATLTSQPVKRITTSMQLQYTSNLQALELQQVLAGTGLPGSSGPTPVSPATVVPVPLAFSVAPLFKVVTFGVGTGIQLGHGFSMNGSIGESHASNDGVSRQWSVGPSYHHAWSSGWLATSYSHGHTDTHANVITANLVNTLPATSSFTLYSQGTDMDTGAVNLTQNLPARFKLTSSAHVSYGTFWDNRVPFPYHNYGGLASVIRSLGEWTLTGSFSIDKNAANHRLIFNESTAKSFSLGAGYRGLTLFVSAQFGDGLALQVGNNLVVIPNPEVAIGVLGIPILSSTTGQTITGSYHSRRNRFMVRGNWGHFSYTTISRPASEYNLFNLNASYKLRRLRLIAGFVKQSQAFSIGSSGNFDTRLIYFQVERNFRVF